MVLGVICVVVPVILVLGLVRKYRESQWGYCNDFKSLQGKVFIVTGANSGIGKETVKGLAIRKARIILACRDLTATNNVIQEIRSTISTGELIPMQLDLSSFDSIHSFADEVLRDFPKINVLINNAGVNVPLSKSMKTKDGFEVHFGVNHLGHFLLTQLLLDRIKDSAPSRIVIVSSTLHESGVIDFDNLNNEGLESKRRMNPAYSNSKLANVYFCQELARRVEGCEIDVFALCPGFCYTSIFKYTDIKWYYYIMFLPVAYLYMRSATQGAQTVLHCAVSDDVIGKSGMLFRNCELYESKHPFNQEIATKLWNVSEQLVQRSTVI
uniref:Retinol dehydrogenase 11 n=2 Tax=Clastoptera arizonana TaxID=38151 RepID=A0A1B6BX84_9HEMI